jgi:hypothetical protein
VLCTGSSRRLNLYLVLLYLTYDGGIDDGIVAGRAESASREDTIFIIHDLEALSLNNNCRVRSNRAAVRVDLLNAIGSKLCSCLVLLGWDGPRVAIESHRSFQRRVSGDQGKVVNLALDFRVAYVFDVPNFFSDLASQILQVEVISETFPEEMDDAFSDRRTLLRGNTEDLRLRIVVESSREGVPVIAVGGDCEVYCAEIV